MYGNRSWPRDVVIIGDRQVTRRVMTGFEGRTRSAILDLDAVPTRSVTVPLPLYSTHVLHCF